MLSIKKAALMGLCGLLVIRNEVIWTRIARIHLQRKMAKRRTTNTKIRTLRGPKTVRNLLKNRGRACKPDSVEPRQVGVLTIIPLVRSSRYGSSSLPEGCSRQTARLLNAGRSVFEGAPQTCLPRAGFRLLCSASRAGSPLLFGLAPRGDFLASPVARRAHGSYPTVSPLPAKAPLHDDEQVSLPPVTAATFRVGLFSVAPSVTPF